MAEAMMFLGAWLDMYSDVFDGYAHDVASELFKEKSIDIETEEGEELFNEFKYDYLIDNLFDQLQDALDSVSASKAWGKWNEKLDEMIGARN